MPAVEKLTGRGIFPAKQPAAPDDGVPRVAEAAAGESGEIRVAPVQPSGHTGNIFPPGVVQRGGQQPARRFVVGGQ